MIYPVTTLRLAMCAVEDGLREIAAEGTQDPVVLDQMQTPHAALRAARYADYTTFDAEHLQFRH